MHPNRKLLALAAGVALAVALPGTALASARDFNTADGNNDGRISSSEHEAFAASIFHSNCALSWSSTRIGSSNTPGRSSVLLICWRATPFDVLRSAASVVSRTRERVKMSRIAFLSISRNCGSPFTLRFLSFPRPLTRRTSPIC